jgi:hypothetical protein
MTSIAKGDRHELARFVLHRQHGHIMIERADQHPLLAEHRHARFLVIAAIDGHVRLAVSPRERRGRKIRDRLPHDFDNRALQSIGIFGNKFLLLLGKCVEVHRAQVAGDHRPAMRVRTIQCDLPAAQLVFLGDTSADSVRQIAIDPHEIQRHQHGLLAGGVFQDERLGPEVGHLAVGRPRTRGIAGHPHRPFGRNVDLGRTRFPGFGAGELVGSNSKREAQ